MERVYELLLAVGYPPVGIDWLRRRRLLTICLLAIAAWMLFLGVGWLIFVLLTG